MRWAWWMGLKLPPNQSRAISLPMPELPMQKI
jgi:hypothetical protein